MPAARIIAGASGETVFPPNQMLACSFEEYKARPGVGSGVLSEPTAADMAACILGYKGKTRAMEDGILLHALLWEPSRYQENYVTYPGRRQGKEWDAFVALNKTKTIITEKELARATEAIDSFRYQMLGDSMKAQILRTLVSDPEAKSELSIFATDEQTGIMCKGRTDRLCGRYIADTKFVVDASEHYFLKNAYNMGYPTQAAHYLEIIRLITGQEHMWLWIAVEKTFPYNISLIRPTPATLLWGQMQRRRSLDLIKRCLDSGLWPGYSDGVIELDCPDWAKEMIK